MRRDTYKIWCGKGICYWKVTVNSMNIKEMSEKNHIEMSYGANVISRSCNMYNDNSIIYLMKKKSSSMNDKEILNWKWHKLMCL